MVESYRENQCAFNIVVGFMLVLGHEAVSTIWKIEILEHTYHRFYRDRVPCRREQGQGRKRARKT